MADLESEEVLQSLYGNELVTCDLPHSAIVHIVPPPLEDMLLNEGLSIESAEGIHVEISIPDGYPANPFTQANIQLHSAWLTSEAAERIVMDALADHPEESDLPLFAIIEAIKVALPMPPEQYWPSSLAPQTIEGNGTSEGTGPPSQQAQPASPAAAEVQRTQFDFMTCPFPLTVGEPFTDRKSTFQAFAARVHSVDDAGIVVDFLKTNSKIRQATHNIVAFRILQDGRSNHDHNSDGEDAAGGRVQHLLQLAGAENVVVMVTRWYGGIHLGPDRFKHINNAARGVLEQGGFLPEKGKKVAKK